MRSTGRKKMPGERKKKRGKREKEKKEKGERGKKRKDGGWRGVSAKRKEEGRAAAKHRGWERKKPGETLGFGVRWAWAGFGLLSRSLKIYFSFAN